MSNLGTGLQQDMLNAQANLNGATSKMLTRMQELAKEVADINPETDKEASAKLQRLQLMIANLQRDMEVLKQMEEKLAKAMETIQKFVQAQ